MIHFGYKVLNGSECHLLRIPQFWPKSNNEDTINSSKLEYRKSTNVIQNECIIEERSSLFDISKYSMGPQIRHVNEATVPDIGIFRILGFNSK